MASTTVSGARVLVTGGSGFLGRRVVDRLREAGASVSAPRSAEHDLRDPSVVAEVLAQSRPDIVVHLAAVVGGIGANQASPGRFFYENAVMGLHLIEEARRLRVGKFVAVGSVCAYPKHAPVPFREDDLWNGYPEETNAPYGLAKKMLLVQLQSYRDEYGFNGVYVLPVNLYGPGDNADPTTSHVIPALIRKCLEAIARGESEVVCWGTGTASREFLYVDDAADAIVAATCRYDGREPVNIGSGDEVLIRDLATRVAAATGFTGTIRWDPSRPDGQPRRRLDVSRARELFGFTASTPLDVGLAATVAWLREALLATPSEPAAASRTRPAG
ncbi:MAG TPA: GDP-L-fucose synthase [Candidatus Dormibacteraeota bacterium]|nr:GDP-L-fucose synthase [Candidatus Dormibacteraeota bacterium]